MTREEGKTLTEGIGETKRAAAILRYYAGRTLDADGETYPSHSLRTFLFARREPIGVVAVITLWNFPIAIPAWKIAPALAYGNTVVWKPAELVPLTAMHLLQALVDAGLPKGVLNVVLGKGSEVGEVLRSKGEFVGFARTGAGGKRVFYAMEDGVYGSGADGAVIFSNQQRVYGACYFMLDSCLAPRFYRAPPDCSGCQAGQC